jgi:hypothetical protein
MSDLLSAIRQDLLDRRMRVPVAVVGLALVAAIAYALLGGSGESASSSGAGTAGAGPGGVPSLSQTSAGTGSNPAVAETTYGAAYQHAGPLVDPFKQLATPATPKTAASGKTAKPAASSAHSGSGSSGGSGGSGGSSGGSSPTPTPTPTPTPKKHTVYVVNVEFGKAPAPGEAPHLVAFKGIRIGQPVPSKSDRLAVLHSASLDAKSLETGEAKASATFTFTGEEAPIVNGPATCVPSQTQCESIRLVLGQTEELQYLQPNGQTVTYLLKLSYVFTDTVLTS